MVTPSRVILPDDPEWVIPASERWSITAAAVVGTEAFFVAAQLEGEIHTLADSYTRLYRFDHGKWLCVVLDVMITGLAAFAGGMLALSELGAVWFVSEDGWAREHLPNDAARVSGKLGMTTSIQVDGDRAVVLGMDGQLYVRDSNGWTEEDTGIAGISPPFSGKHLDDAQETAWLSRYLKGTSTEYACGNFDHQFPALFVRESPSRDWRWIDVGNAVSIPRMRLYAMCEQAGSLYIGSSIGVVLKKSDHSSIEVCSTAVNSQLAARPAVLSGATIYRDMMYFSGNGGLFTLRDATLEPIRGPRSLPIRRGEQGTTSILGNNILVAHDSMWVFSANSISRMVGGQWERIAIPSLYKD